MPYREFEIGLPPAALHNPAEVAEFVKTQMSPETVPRPIQRQYLGVLACQNVGNIQRFLHDAHEAIERSDHTPPHVFVMDDSWDNDIAADIQAVTEAHGADYHRVRSPMGLGNEIIDEYCKDLSDDLSSSQRTRLRWLARASLRNYMDVPIADPDEGSLEVRGGCGGARNLGYLTAIYEAGRADLPLEDIIVTINDDDHRYYTISKDESGRVQKEWHDFFSERRAWFSDPLTSVAVGRYVGHRGNPIAAIQGALESCRDIVAEKVSGQVSRHTIMNETDDRFELIDSTEAFENLPEIIQSILRRQPTIGFVTHDSYDKRPTLDWEHAKVNFGSITLRGTTAANLPIPASALYDYNFGSLLRSTALNSGYPNRALRVEQAIMHQRRVRDQGGDAGSSTIDGIFTNGRGIDQTKLMRVIRNDEDLRNQIITELNIPSDYFDRLLIDNQANSTRIEAIRTCLNDIASLSTQIPPEDQTPQLRQSLQLLQDSLPDEMLSSVVESLRDIEPDNEEVVAIKRGVRRYLDSYKIWPKLSQAAYRLGQQSE